MSDDAAEDDLADLQAKVQVWSGRIAGARRQIARIKAIKADCGNAERIVNDHALIRYLQRYKGVDIDAARAEVRALATESEEVDDLYIHPSGAVMVLGDEGQVITVLSPDQRPKRGGGR